LRIALLCRQRLGGKHQRARDKDRQSSGGHFSGDARYPCRART
jgi:hypothetical protein